MNYDVKLLTDPLCTCIFRLKGLSRYFTENERPNFLNGCRHVYLDVGSNVGVQVRKLFQPELYDKAPIIPAFRTNFGDPK